MQIVNYYFHEKKWTATWLIFFCCASLSSGQDHYWSLQYGGQAILMGGTAVVGVNDNSCLYYNPGTVGFVDSARLTATTFAFGFEYIRLKDGAGPGLDLKSVLANVLPQLLAGSMPFKKIPKLKLLYGTLTRMRTNIRFTFENENEYEIVEGSPGLEFYKARGEYVNNSVEQWGGFGFSYKINKTWAIGLSSFGAFTHMEMRSTQTANIEGISNGIPYTASVNEYNSLRLDQITHVFKLGAAARFKHLHLGIALTLPGIKIWSSGKLEKSLEIYNLSQHSSDTLLPGQKYPNYIISDAQKNLKSQYRIPLSASVGIKITYPKFSVAASVEYFMGYKTRSILQGTDRSMIRPASIYGNKIVPDFMQLQTAVSPVLNAGIGMQIRAQTNVDLLMGVRTDFSNRSNYLPNNESLQMNSIKKPIWHYLYFSSGFTYKLASHNFTFGFDYGLGIAENKKGVLNLAEPQQEFFLRGPAEGNMKTSVHKLSLILSYTYFFKAKEKKFGPIAFIEELRRVKKKERQNRSVNK